jgi:hypothetical protein
MIHGHWSTHHYTHTYTGWSGRWCSPWRGTARWSEVAVTVETCTATATWPLYGPRSWTLGNNFPAMRTMAKTLTGGRQKSLVISGVEVKCISRTLQKLGQDDREEVIIGGKGIEERPVGTMANRQWVAEAKLRVVGKSGEGKRPSPSSLSLFIDKEMSTSMWDRFLSRPVGRQRHGWRRRWLRTGWHERPE